MEAAGEVRCCYCHTLLYWETMTLEHVVPLSRGGSWDLSNLAAACGPCNHGRGRALNPWARRRH